MNDTTVAALMWTGVGVGYAWSVWKLDRLWRHAFPDDSARGEPQIVLDRRVRVAAGRPGTGRRDGPPRPVRASKADGPPGRETVARISGASST
jgi:hypothetical protein